MTRDEIIAELQRERWRDYYRTHAHCFIDTVEGEALERLARFVWAPLGRRPGETDVELRERVRAMVPGPITHAAPTPALAIGTRVRIDDKTHPCHDRVGTVTGVAPDGLIHVDGDGWVATEHRANLALVDDTLPECTECEGRGSIPLFTSADSDCPACGGTGVVIP